MKVTINRISEEVSLEDLHRGDFFLYENKLYMVMEVEQTAQAFNFDGGNIDTFDRPEEIFVKVVEHKQITIEVNI